MRKSILNSLIPREAAIEKFMKAWNPQSEPEIVKLEEAAGRVTAVDIFSMNSLPVYRASMADGIAVRKSDFKDGLPDTSDWQKNRDYAQADTGDDFADEFDSVIRIEDVSFDEGGKLVLSPDINIHDEDNVRPGGSIIKAGELILKKDTKISEIQLAALAAGGIEALPVYKKPKTVFIPTGNELVPRGVVPLRGKNVESNSIMVKALLEKMGAEVICYDIVRDDIGQLSAALERALDEGDIIIICAGTAKGEEDYTHLVLEKYSTVIQHGILTAPGRPVGFAISGNKPVINIPGPTLGAYYAVDLCVAPLVGRMLHQSPAARETVKVILANDVESAEGMEFIIRMKIEEKDGSLVGHSITPYASLAAAARECNALLFVPIGVKGYKEGDEVEVELLYGR